MHPGHWMRIHHKRSRFFERGALRLLILDLIAEKPRHGYDIIREIEERSGGYYSPSPGAVYPNLQLLEDEGHVRVSEGRGKKVYELTEPGRSYVDEHREGMRAQRERMAGCCPGGASEGAENLHDIRSLMHSIGHSAWEAARDPLRAGGIKTILERAKADIDSLPKA